MAEKKTATKAVSKYSKEQFLNAKNPTYNVDAMYVVLDDDKLYTKDEAMKLYSDFMQKEVK